MLVYTPLCTYLHLTHHLNDKQQLTKSFTFVFAYLHVLHSCTLSWGHLLTVLRLVFAVIDMCKRLAPQCRLGSIALGCFWGHSGPPGGFTRFFMPAYISTNQITIISDHTYTVMTYTHVSPFCPSTGPLRVMFGLAS